MELGIIVVPSRSDIEQVLKQLHAGMDFSVLAKERSVDATAVDGGYMGRTIPEQLRAEYETRCGDENLGISRTLLSCHPDMRFLRFFQASSRHRPKPEANFVSDVHRRHPLRRVAFRAGRSERHHAAIPKRDGWNRDLPEVCRLRKESLSHARSDLRRALLNVEPKPEMDHDTAVDQINGHAALAQLFAYSGEMDDSIEEWKIAYQMAEREVPVFLPNLQESLGTAYLHRSGIHNGVYLDSTNLDIFPPLKNQSGYKRRTTRNKRFVTTRNISKTILKNLRCDGC